MAMESVRKDLERTREKVQQAIKAMDTAVAKRNPELAWSIQQDRLEPALNRLERLDAYLDFRKKHGLD